MVNKTQSNLSKEALKHVKRHKNKGRYRRINAVPAFDGVGHVNRVSSTTEKRISGSRDAPFVM